MRLLFNASKPQGFGYLQKFKDPMTIEEARELLEDGSRFDYVRGRVMKVNLSGDTLKTVLYDRDNGEGAARQALNSML